MLKSYNYGYAKAVADHPFSIFIPGSEFRNIVHLKLILQHRQNWQELENIITKGVTYPLKNCPSEQVRISDLRARVQRGNHQSALRYENAQSLKKATNKEVAVCFLLPIKIKSIFKILGAGALCTFIA